MILLIVIKKQEVVNMGHSCWLQELLTLSQLLVLDSRREPFNLSHQKYIPISQWKLSWTLPQASK